MTTLCSFRLWPPAGDVINLHLEKPADHSGEGRPRAIPPVCSTPADLPSVEHPLVALVGVGARLNVRREPDASAPKGTLDGGA